MDPRNWIRLLRRHITVLVVPHSDLPLWRFCFTLNFILFCVALWSAITICSGFLIGRNLDYWITKADNQLMRTKMGLLMSEIDRSRQDLERARETDSQMRTLLGMRSRKAVIETEEGVGGPDAADRMNLLRLLVQDPVRISPALIHKSVRALRKESQRRLASFQEIQWYISNRRSLYRSTPLGWPTQGRITSLFGYRFPPVIRLDDAESRDQHSGLDIANSADTPILATADGVVRQAGWHGGYGQMILIDHDWGYSTLYAHTSNSLVRKGEPVKRGQMIGYMGTTGRSTGNHIHYEVWRNGRPVNPMRYLKERYEEDIR